MINEKLNEMMAVLETAREDCAKFENACCDSVKFEINLCFDILSPLSK